MDVKRQLKCEYSQIRSTGMKMKYLSWLDILIYYLDEKIKLLRNSVKYQCMLSQLI